MPERGQDALPDLGRNLSRSDCFRRSARIEFRLSTLPIEPPYEGVHLDPRPGLCCNQANPVERARGNSLREDCRTGS